MTENVKLVDFAYIILTNKVSSRGLFVKKVRKIEKEGLKKVEDLKYLYSVRLISDGFLFK